MLSHASETCYQAQNPENVIILDDSGAQEEAQSSLLKFSPNSGFARLDLSAQSENFLFTTSAFQFSPEKARYRVECDGGGVDLATSAGGELLLNSGRMTGVIATLTEGCSSGQVQIKEVVFKQVSCDSLVSK